MVNRECGICGNVFGVKGYDKRSKYCSVECRGESRRLRQAEYRKTDRGITNTKRYNSKFKRPDIERECLCCNDKFITARESKLFCDKEECRKSARSYYSARCRNRHKEHYKVVGNANKVAWRMVEKGSCIVCGSDKDIDMHHHNYNNKKDVTHFCRKHHREMHSWDSFRGVVNS